ncbi:hypothetical protein LO762_14490 [Actinocorallia sp. API 0066]|uniref:hypothetical protein n=1 Tax=Actinocorallia sp. API 0066 TaxID=2896846 RepID=UPI001E37A7A3|nr:hypothetical protein [Actinocorallia sp. API 0066]MCD0450391.1 hypothetical protein [Actinocorallia sp. API 0066]
MSSNRVVLVVVAVVAVVVLIPLAIVVAAASFVTLRSEETGGGPVVVEEIPAPAPAPDEAAIRIDQITGSWDGTYTCSGKVRALRLTINLAGNDGLEARFVFFTGPTQAGAPHGSYTMSGGYDGSVVTLQGREWISRPDAYVMVDLRGTPSRSPAGGLTMAGQATHCAGFAVTKSGS